MNDTPYKDDDTTTTTITTLAPSSSRTTSAALVTALVSLSGSSSSSPPSPSHPTSALAASSSISPRDLGNVATRCPPDDPDHCHVVLAVDAGLDEATIAGYPKLLRGTEGSMTALCCSICLEDYKGRDSLRLLPDCGHLFHPKCIDPWLRSHPTCPVCRTSPLPTPMLTPLAEVVPLTSRRS